MPTARTAKTVAYVAATLVAVGGVGVGVAVELSHSASGRAAAASSVAALGGAPTGQPASSLTPSPVITPAVLRVPPLHKLTPPDVIVTMTRPASLRAVQRLRKRPGVRRVVLADRGSVALHGVRLHVLGVPLSTIRGFTPKLTATSTPLWTSVARGELTVGYAHSRRLRHRLGATYAADGYGGKVAPLRIGAFATIGLNGTQALLSEPAGRVLGLAPDRVALVAAPKVPIDALTGELHKAFGAKAHLDVTRATPVNQSISSSYATETIPAGYLSLYRRAAVTCPGLPWTVLAGIGTVETGNGRDVHKSTAGAEGPMQFLPSTWSMYGYDADGDGKANINDPTDAVFSAARYLCAAGAGRGGMSLDDAVFSYNHAWWYVREVITIANRYA
ncbi:MAG TPA: lytic transglycosylase domain-containing protein [Mycobacteriales bacterium]|jgi:hypothetical protein|nr:lytic transglycosylase domain-containing protein [Mycobacteriales bacterium]